MSLESVLVTPLQHFHEEHEQPLKEKKKAFDSAISEYRAAHSRTLHSATKNKVDGEKLSESEQELSTLKQMTAEKSYEFIGHLMEFSQMKEYHSIECFSAYIQAQLVFFTQGYKVMQEVEPLLQNMSQIIRQMRINVVTERKERRDNAEKLQELMAFMDKTRVANIRSINEKHGYLHKKSNSVVGDWKRRWCTIRDGCLLYFKNSKDSTPAGSIPLMLSSVKDAPKAIDKYHCFELVSMRQNRSFYFQAENEQDKQEWISILQNNIALIINGLSANMPPKDAVPAHLSSLWEIPGNNTCADCGSTDPDWTSINMGILLCIDCSGCHRSLGTHISKVRSLRLDKMDDFTIEFLKKIGNEKSNKIWAELSPEDAFASMGREVYIKEKYANKAFVSKCENPAAYMKSACEEGNIDRIFKALASGVNIDHNVGDTPFLHSTIKSKSFDCFYALFLNGANINQMDGITGDSPLHVAASSDENYNILTILLKSGANCSCTNRARELPVDVASRWQQPQNEEALLIGRLSHMANLREISRKATMVMSPSNPK